MPDDRPLIPSLEPEGERPGAYAELPPDPPRLPIWRRCGARATAVGAGWGALIIGLEYGLGVGGWRNASLVAAGLAIGAAACVWLALGPGIHGRAQWTAAIAIMGLSLAFFTARGAPPSAPRLAGDIDRMGFANQLYTRVSSVRRGHGWCSPQCPEVVRIYRAPNGSYQEGLVIALAGLHRMGLIGDLKQAYDAQTGLLIVRHGRRVSAEVSLSRTPANQVEVRVDLRAVRAWSWSGRS